MLLMLKVATLTKSLSVFVLLGAPTRNKRIDCSGRALLYRRKEITKTETKTLTYTNWKDDEMRKGPTRKPKPDEPAKPVKN